MILSNDYISMNLGNVIQIHIKLIGCEVWDMFKYFKKSNAKNNLPTPKNYDTALH